MNSLSKIHLSCTCYGADTFNGTVPLGLDKGIAKQSEIVAIFDLPTAAAKLSVNIGSGGPGTTVTRWVGTQQRKVQLLERSFLTATSHIASFNSDRLMDKTDLPGDDYNITHHPKGTPATVCQVQSISARCPKLAWMPLETDCCFTLSQQQACDADSECLAWTYVIRGTDGGGDCCKKSSVPCPVTSSPVDPQCTSGAKTVGWHARPWGHTGVQSIHALFVCY